MGDHPNAEALRKGYGAFATGDMETVASLFADDIAWHQAGNSSLAGDFAGKDAVFGNLAQLAELTGGTFGQEVHGLLADDEHASSWSSRGGIGRVRSGARASTSGT